MSTATTATIHTDLRLTVQVTFHEQHFNRTARATIPAYYRAEVTDGLPERQSLTGDFYADGFTRQEALSLLGAELKRAGFSGTMKVQGQA